MNLENDIQVSVCVLTYNQESYIAECLESLVNQVTTFKYEIIVGEDCSTDSTRAIVQRYVEKYPDLIVPLFYKNNIGAVENMKQVYKTAKSKYIAHMDGDDLALPGKLQLQYDILNIHSDCIICSHNVAILDINKNKMDYESSRFAEGKYNRLDLIKDLPFFAHSSKMFRNIKEINWYEFLTDKNMIDINIHLEQAKYGDVYHIGNVLGVYRVNVGMTSTSNHKINTKVVDQVKKTYKKLLLEEKEPNLNVVKYSYSKYLLNLVYDYIVIEQDYQKSRYYYLEALKMKAMGKKQFLFLVLYILPEFSLSFIGFLKIIKRKLNVKFNIYLK